MSTIMDDPVERAARKIYARVLSQWAIDLLRLRRDGLDVPTERAPESDLLLPRRGKVVERPLLDQPAQADIRWKPTPQRTEKTRTKRAA